MTGSSEGPLVSIVINNYNYAQFLPQAIDSALSQNHRPVEVVVVDDGSTDESRAIIMSYGDRVVSAFQENGGMGSAINAGFRASRGDIVVFLDADDVLLPTAAGEAARLMADSRVVKVHWNMREMDGDGADTGQLVPREALPEGDLREIATLKGPMAAGGPPTSGNAWARRFLEEVLPMPQRELRQHADAYLNTLACLFGEFRTTPEPQARYRIHGNNDYASQPMIDRLRRNLHMYHYRCRLFSDALRRLGENIQPAAWKTDDIPYYFFLQRRFGILQQIAALIPRSDSFVLVDDGAFGDGPLVDERECIRFPVSPATPRGAPPNDQAAIDALEDMRRDGAQFLIFVKPALWWLQNFPGLLRHLESNYTRELSSENVHAFNLST